MINKRILCTIAALFFISALPLTSQAGNMGQQGKAKEQQLHALFLINGKLPHLMKPIRAHWDDSALGLTPQQKKQLKDVQKESMLVVNQLKKEIPPLEEQVKKEMMAGKSPEEIKPLVEKIAALKSKGTMIHLSCLYKVRSILTPEQRATLRKLNMQ
jgi:Spy/CpxP family protein refolding chaperone